MNHECPTMFYLRKSASATQTDPDRPGSETVLPSMLSSSKDWGTILGLFCIDLGIVLGTGALVLAIAGGLSGWDRDVPYLEPATAWSYWLTFLVAVGIFLCVLGVSLREKETDWLFIGFGVPFGFVLVITILYNIFGGTL